MSTSPVSVVELRAFLRLEHDAEDALLGVLAETATGMVEEATSRLLTPQAVRQDSVRGFPNGPAELIRLWKGPVRSIVAIGYDPADGSAAATLADYRLVEGVNGGLLPAFGSGWPAARDGRGSVRIDYQAGYDADDLPSALRTAVLLMAASLYHNREGGAAGGMPRFIRDMIAPFAPVGLA